MIRNVLVSHDGSALSERAVPYAACLARASGGQVWLVHAMPAVPALVHPWSELDVAVHIEGLAARLRERGIGAVARTMHGPATEVILSAAADAHADAIVMSTHGRSGIGRWLYGSVADEVLSRAKVPVMMVPARCSHAWTEGRPLKMLVPLDGSDLAEEALEPARSLAALTGGSIVMVRVVDRATAPAFSVDPVGFSIGLASERATRGAQEYLEALSGDASTSGRLDTLVEVGDPAATIATLAEAEGADLIVMATHGRTGLARLTMGSVATAMLQRAHTPIMLTRPARLSRPAPEPTEARDTRQQTPVGGR